MHFDTGPTSWKTGQISPLAGPIFTPQHCGSVQSFPLETPGSDSIFLNNLYNQEHNFVTMAIVELRFLGLFYSQYSSQMGKGPGKIIQDHTTKAVETSSYPTGSKSTGDGYNTPEHHRKTLPGHGMTLFTMVDMWGYKPYGWGYFWGYKLDTDA